MSRKFYAVNRETGERWKSRENFDEFLILYSDGELGVIDDSGYYLDAYSLPSKDWEVVF